MDIREFAKSDLKQVISLWGKCQLVFPRNNPEVDIERKLLVDPQLFLVGVLEQKIVASVMGGYEGHRGWINYLAVDPAFRRRGFGKAIMKAVESRLKEMGCPKINLQVRVANVEIISFYEALGFSHDNVIGLGKRLIEDDPYSD